MVDNYSDDDGDGDVDDTKEEYNDNDNQRATSVPPSPIPSTADGYPPVPLTFQGSNYSRSSISNNYAPATPSNIGNRPVLESSQTPLALATPRSTGNQTPHSIRSNLALQSDNTRGNVGRMPQVPLFRSNIQGRLSQPATPGTPNSWTNDGGYQMTPSSNNSDDGDEVNDIDAMIDDTTYDPDAVIWGTNVNIRTNINAFRNFIINFKLNPRNFDEEAHYLNKLETLYHTGQTILNINCKDLMTFVSTRNFLKQLQEFPQEVILNMDVVINEEYEQRYGEVDSQKKIQVRIYGLPELSHMRTLDPTHIDQLVSLKGMVIRVSQIIPDCKSAFFKCSVCGYSVDKIIDRGNIDEPRKCDSCSGEFCMEIFHNRCIFSNKQVIRLQETPDEIPEGETPYSVNLFSFDDLVDSVRPGDRIEVTGIMRALPRRPNYRQRTVQSVFKIHIDCIHFRRSDLDNEGMTNVEDVNIDGVGRGDDINNSKTFSAERIHEFREFVNQGNVYERLVRAFAPSIWEMEDVKKGILCQLFGGTLQKTQEQIRANAATMNRNRIDTDTDTDRNRFGDFDHSNNENTNINGNNDDANADGGHSARVHLRGDINILLCGDPGTSKSQLLSYVNKITPRGIYTSGKGSSAVGLTASVVRDTETKDMVLESGALVLSDNGICCIDEFDKMSDITRAILHEAMEQQTVSITKAGIIATLNARTSILASANPVESRYNARLSVVENIKLPPTLLSRFDLIYLVLDKPNPDADRRLAKHLISLYYADDVVRNTRTEVDQDFLRDFIIYARSTVFPEIEDDAVEVLVQGYLAMRAMGGRGSKTITATPRQLESLIRISQALAKMQLQDVVTSNEVNEAIRLMRVATQAAATDPRTGTIDMDLITTGRTSLDKELIHKMAEELASICSNRNGQRLTVAQLRQLLLKNASSSISISMMEVEEAVRELETEGLGQFIERTSTFVIR